MEIKGNKITCIAGMDEILVRSQLDMNGIFDATDEQVQELILKGETSLKKSNVEEDMFSSFLKGQDTKVETESKKESVSPHFFDFEEDSNDETIGEYMSYIFTDDWNISKAQVRRGIAVEETALEFLSNGKCKMNKRTVSGPAINYLKGIASEIRPTVTGMDGKVYSTVITKEEGETKIIRFTVMESTGDVTITYFLKKRNTLARERELAMWR